MAIKIQNVSKQVIPLIIEGNQINLKARETVVLGLNKETPQIAALKSRGLIKVKR